MSNDYISEISFSMGQRALEPYVKKVEYPYSLKKAKIYFYGGNGSMCFPVEKSKQFMNICLNDHIDKNRIFNKITKIKNLLSNQEDGNYIIDFEREKLVYNCTTKKDLVPFSILAPIKPYSIFVLGISIVEERKELILLKDTLVSFAEALTQSHYLIKPAELSEFGCQVFTRISQNLGFLDELDTSVFFVREWYNPSQDSLSFKSFVPDISDLAKRAIKKKDDTNKEIIEKSSDKLLLSKVLETGKAPIFNKNGQQIIFSRLEIDIQPEGLKIISAVINKDQIIIEIDRPIIECLDILSEISDSKQVIFTYKGNKGV